MLTTNVMRILEKQGIRFSSKEYEYDESDLSGQHAAEALGLPPEKVFKTLVAAGDKTPHCVFVIPVAEELDLKKCAAVSGNKGSQQSIPATESDTVHATLRIGYLNEHRRRRIARDTVKD